MLRAARAATEFAGGAPLIFGGDLNLRPAEDPAVFERLREDFGLAAPTGAAGDRPPADPRPRGARGAGRMAAGAPRAAARRARPAALRPRSGAGAIRRGRATDAAELT